MCQKANEEGVLDGGNGVKIFLGLRWDPKTDRFSLSRLDLGINRKFKSKREVLSQLSKIFDPIGILSLITFRAKLLMQDIWQENVTWDERLQESYQEKWFELAEELRNLLNYHLLQYQDFYMKAQIESIWFRINTYSQMLARELMELVHTL